MAVRSGEDVALALEPDRIIWLDPESARTIGM
jgi:hypothetical protein